MRTAKVLLGCLLLATIPCAQVAATSQPDTLARALNPPEPGTATLRVLSPGVLAVELVNTKPADPTPIDSWDLTVDGVLQLPAPGSFTVTIDGSAAEVTRVGFKRRPLYAPLRTRDLRVANALYLEIQPAVETGQTVIVTTTDPRLGASPGSWSAVADPDRWSPAIHANQVGYVPDLAKLAFVGEFLGTLGELDLPAGTPFTVEAIANQQVFYSGTLASRPDVGFTVTPRPYQSVLVADFTELTTPGDYRLRVNGLGVSLPFRISTDVSAALARTYALGLYQQRCGTAVSLPWSRHTHDVCHADPAAIPGPEMTFVTTVLEAMTADYANNPRHTAPRLSSVEASLYPWVQEGSLDVSGGHHDAGDYSKYTINSAGLIHHLVFAADNFPGTASLDNLGIPESGDGLSDLLQEAKWEADFLVKLQDSDGGFAFLVYPRDRKYENDVLPDEGDPQVVYPKNTSATAAAVGALAEAASSPVFRSQFPEAAARYLAAARVGWGFLQRALAAHGRDGAYQKLSHYGDVFMHDDELAWAAAAMYAATGEAECDAELRSHFDPASPAMRRWTWWRLFEAAGAATRTYAFASRSGRLPADRLEPVFLAKCEAEIVARAEDLRRWSQQTAYGTAFPEPSKRQNAAGWYFSTAQAFDLAVAVQLEPRPEWLAALADQVNFEGGANPVNICFLTGLGVQRPLNIVSQFALNDHRMLPPSGLPVGCLQSGFSYLDTYRKELGALCIPNDGLSTGAYPLYDRWGDIWNTRTEAVVVDQARGLATTAFLMARTSLRDQPWIAPTASLRIASASAPGEWECELEVPTAPAELTEAVVVWEAADAPVQTGSALHFTTSQTGEQWIEAEALWPDGRRVVAASRFLAAAPPRPGLPLVTIRATSGPACESPSTTAWFEVLRTGDSLQESLSVSYAIGGTARNGTDYAWINGSQYNVRAGTVTLPAGTNRALLRVLPKTDNLAEGAETVLLTVSPEASYDVGLPHQAEVKILDDPGSNHLPVAEPLLVRFENTSPVGFTLSGMDPDGDPIDFVIASLPTSGTLLGDPPDLVYVPDTTFDGVDQFTYYVRDALGQSAEQTVELARDYGQTAALFSFNQPLEEPVGELPGFGLEGNPQQGQGTVRFSQLQDLVRTTLPAEALYVEGETTAISLEAHLFVEQFLGYGVATVPLVRLYKSWNSFLELRQDKWARSAQVREGSVTVASTASLAGALTPGAWHRIAIRLDTASCTVTVDDQLVANVATADLRNWRGSVPVTLEIGHFAGWVDWVELRTETGP